MATDPHFPRMDASPDDEMLDNRTSSPGASTNIVPLIATRTALAIAIDTGPEAHHLFGVSAEIIDIFKSIGIGFIELKDKEGDESGGEMLLVYFPGDPTHYPVDPAYVQILWGEQSPLIKNPFIKTGALLKQAAYILVVAFQEGFISMANLKAAFIHGTPDFSTLINNMLDCICLNGKQQQLAEAFGLGRNDACWCGSGLKFKKCHGVSK